MTCHGFLFGLCGSKIYILIVPRKNIVKIVWLGFREFHSYFYPKLKCEHVCKLQPGLPCKDSEQLEQLLLFHPFQQLSMP